MTEETFQARMAELRERVRGLPAEQQAALEGLFAETEQRFRMLQENRGRLGTALADWRLILKYALFDLEATKRELTHLRERQDGEQPE